MFELADIASKARNGKPATISPIAFEAVQKFDAIFALERTINGLSPEARVAVRRKEIAPLVNDLVAWMKRERGKLSRHNEVAKAFDYMLKRIDVFTRFLDDGRICLSNDAAERTLRGIALGRKSWLFAGSDRGGDRAAVLLTLPSSMTLIPSAWLADVLARIIDHNVHRRNELLPWNLVSDREHPKVAGMSAATMPASRSCSITPSPRFYRSTHAPATSIPRLSITKSAPLSVYIRDVLGRGR